MSLPINRLQTYFSLIMLLLLSGCMISHRDQVPEIASDLQVTLNQYKQSDFKQVEVTFVTHQSKARVLSVLSDIKKTAQWLQRVERLEVVTAYNNHQYLLRTVINSPWPFQDRELISCVDTFFEDEFILIKIYSCSDRVPIDDQYLRLLNVQSSWEIREVSDSLVEVNYKTWIDPAGAVPAFIFNNELMSNTKVDVKKLKVIIENR